MQDQPVGDPSDRSFRRSIARRRGGRVTAGLGLLALIAAAAYLSTLPLGGAPAATRAPDASFLAIGSGTERVGIGQAAPDFVAIDGNHAPLLVSLDGKPIRLDDFSGKPLWIVFWATWCTPCQQEASDIRASYQAHRGDDLAVLAIDIQEPAVAVREYALEHHLDYAIGLDSSAAVKALYGGWGLPAHFFVDGNGVIRDRYLGQMTRELMEQHLQAIIGS
jgi:cytochrome c biogenesis protein CcmG, thiol:disulfide interchange protein DsbE